uniref:Protein white n=1 Tax=Strigamia maritima TaxID=126957 RepID=T1JB20_STRMM
MKKWTENGHLLPSTKKNYSTHQETCLESQPIIDKNNCNSEHLPSEILLTWKDVNVHCVQVSKQKCCSWFRKKSVQSTKQILYNVNGLAKPGELLAIMGASGAGKSTLLNILTIKNQNALTVSGQVLINHQPVTSKVIAAVSAYVQQDDLFVGTLTVKEQLIFQVDLTQHAMLRMANKTTYPQILRRVNEVILELGLQKCQDTLIGIIGRVKGISGGEKRRLAVACEVLTNPSLMFCDEPTSGLDSSMAQNVVCLLRSLAQKGKTIICTIHQPSSQLYALFDKILFLAEGRVAFLGTRNDALSFFNNLNFHCPSNYNPADYFIHTLAVTVDEMEEKKSIISDICNSFKNSENYKAIKKEIDVDHNVEYSQLLDQKLKSPYKVSWIKQSRAVLWRSCVSVYREPLLIKMRIMQTLLVGFFVGFVYYRQDLTQLSVNNVNGAMYILLVSSTFQNLFAVINVLSSELPIFLREHWSGLYRSDVYFFSKTLAEAPIFIVMPFLLSAISYWLIGFYPDAIKFIIASIINILVANAATSFGYLISAVSSTTTMALSVGPPAVLPLLLFGGFFLNKRSVPWYLNWLQYISWFKYAFEALAINQWKDVKHIECNVNNITCPKSGLVILQTFDFFPNFLFWPENSDIEFVPNIICLVALIVLIRLAAFIAFSIRASRKP